MPERLSKAELVARLVLEGKSVVAIAAELRMSMGAVREQKGNARRLGLLGDEHFSRLPAAPGHRRCRGHCHQVLKVERFEGDDDRCRECRSIINLRLARWALLKGEPLPAKVAGPDPMPLWRALGLPEPVRVPVRGRIVRLEPQPAEEEATA